MGEIVRQRRGGADIARRLADICGARFARPAGAADDVAGVTARWVAAPGSPEAATEVVKLAAEHELSVVARGAGTKLDWGATPSQLDIVLDTGRLAGVWHRPAAELVAEIGAGTPVRAVGAILERAGVRLPLDVPSFGATIGGVVAAGESGPLRHLHGTPCDQLVGVSYVDASGVLAHAGPRADVRATARATARGAGVGSTVESDVTRLLCGSQGALGVLVSATMRVQPIPASRVWVTRSVWTPLEVHDLVRGILAAELRPTAIEVDLPAGRGPGRGSRSGASGGRPSASPSAGHPPPEGPAGHPPPEGPAGHPPPEGPAGHPSRAVIDTSGHPAGRGRVGDRGWFGTPGRPADPTRPDDQGRPTEQGRPGPRGGFVGSDRLGERGSGTLAVLLEGGPAEVAERVHRLTGLLGGDVEAASAAPPWWRRYPFQSDEVALRIEVPIDDLHAAVYALRDAVGVPVPVRGSAGLGVVHAALAATTPPERVANILEGVRAVLRARSGRCLVVAAPRQVREAVDLWGELPDLPLLRQVKERFDPGRRLAPGRYPGGI